MSRAYVLGVLAGMGIGAVVTVGIFSFALFDRDLCDQIHGRSIAAPLAPTPVASYVAKWSDGSASGRCVLNVVSVGHDAYLVAAPDDETEPVCIAAISKMLAAPGEAIRNERKSK